MTRREQVLDAAVMVLAYSGGRGLSHRAVDQAAAVPAGTTSNYFKTRRALLLGTRNRLVERLAAYPPEIPTPLTETELVGSVGAILRSMLGPRGKDVLAHAALLLDATYDGELAEGLDAELDREGTQIAGWLASFGVTFPERNAIVLISYMRALMYGELLAPVPDFDADAAVEPLVLGMLSDSQSFAGATGTPGDATG